MISINPALGIAFTLVAFFLLGFFIFEGVRIGTSAGLKEWGGKRPQSNKPEAQEPTTQDLRKQESQETAIQDLRKQLERERQSNVELETLQRDIRSLLKSNAALHTELTAAQNDLALIKSANTYTDSRVLDQVQQLNQLAQNQFTELAFRMDNIESQRGFSRYLSSTQEAPFIENGFEPDAPEIDQDVVNEYLDSDAQVEPVNITNTGHKPASWMVARPLTAKDFKLSYSALKALQGAGVKTLADAQHHTAKSLLAIKFVGPGAVAAIQMALAEHGTSLTTEKPVLETASKPDSTEDIWEEDICF